MCRILPLFPDNKFSRPRQSWLPDTSKIIRRVWHSTLFICAIHKISVGHMFLWSNPLDRYHWLMIAFIMWNSNSAPLIEGLSSSNPCRFYLSVLGVCRVEPMTLGLTVPRSGQLSKFYIVSDTGSSREIETTVFDPASQFLSNISRRV